MVKIICTTCEKENKYLSESDVRPECDFCFTFFEQPATIIECGDTLEEPESLTIIYQITQQRIEITTDKKIILGRESFGKEVFSQILHNGKPTISRRHCSIEFKDGKFILSDEGSLNGTFAGVNKLDCRNNPQIIEHNSILFIGKEPFLAQINFKQKKSDAEENKPTEETTRKIKHYRCNDQNCSGYTSEEIFDYCPECSSFNNFIVIYD